MTTPARIVNILMKTFFRLMPLLSALFYASKQLVMQAPPVLTELPLRISDKIALQLECFQRRKWETFIDILIVSILTTVWLETLMRPICQLQRFSDPVAYLNLKPQTNIVDKGVVLL